jgi:Zn-dependent oligopeptidase
MLEQLKSVPNEARTFENTLVALDDIYDQVYKIKSPIGLMNSVHPDDSIRQTAMRESDHLMALIQRLDHNIEIYHAVKEYSQTEEAKILMAHEKKLLRDIMFGFKRHGLELQTKDAEIFQEVMTEASQLGMSFFRNAQSAYDTLWISEDQLAGLSDKFKKSHQTDDSKFFIDLPGPSFDEVMQNAQDEVVRKQVYYKRENIAYDVNRSVLNKLLSARQRLAQLLGYKNYTEYALEIQMAKTYENVIQLEEKLSEKMRIITQQQHEELLQLKREHLNNPKLTVLNPWDIQYYNKIYEEKYLAINQDSIKSYFETDQVLNGLLEIGEKLFDIKFQEVKDPSVWHPDVYMYKVIDKNSTIGYIYFDLFFRKGKASQGAFAWPIKDRKLVKNGVRHPIIAIGCNFTPPTDKEPSLLSLNNLEYLFHEFGHAMHHLLGKNDLILQSAFSVENDFTEVPSQIWENWVWDEEGIAFLSKHYKTGEKMPKDIIKKIASTRQRRVFSHQLMMLRYSMIDRIMHTDYFPDQSFNFEAMHKEIWNEIMPYSYPSGIFTETCMFPIGFSKYAACWYGFLWADIYAKDMFSVFKKNGIFNPKTGARFRECILDPGSSKPAIEMANCFLGRSVDESAFLNALGLVDK